MSFLRNEFSRIYEGVIYGYDSYVRPNDVGYESLPIALGL